MGFHFATGRPLPEEVRRVLLEQTTLALEALHGDDVHAGVHTARKACKRTRATLSLVRGWEGRKTLSHRFRDAARHVSGLRDDHVMRALLADLDQPPLPSEPPDPTPPVARTLEALASVQDTLLGASFEAVDLEMVGRGLRNGHRAARRGLRDACGGGCLHTWRKAVKAHMYHLDLVRDAWPVGLRPLRHQADVLQERLGQHNDLVVLVATLGERPAGWAQRVETLRTTALELGAVLFRPRPRAWADLVVSAWRGAP